MNIIFCLFIVIIFVIPFIVTTMANEDFYFIQSEFPTLFCLSRNADFNFGYLLFPAVFLSGLGIFLLIFILFHIQLVRKCMYANISHILSSREKNHLYWRICFFTGQNKFSSNVLFERKLPHIPICLKQSSSVIWTVAYLGMGPGINDHR